MALGDDASAVGDETHPRARFVTLSSEGNHAESQNPTTEGVLRSYELHLGVMLTMWTFECCIQARPAI